MPDEQLNLEVVNIVRDWDNLAKRTEYERRLHELGPTAVETLLVLVRRDIQKNKRNQRIGLLCIALAGVFLFASRFLYKNQSWLKVLLEMLKSALMIPAFYLMLIKRHRAAKILADFDDVRAIGPLIEAWEDDNARVILYEALIRLLPQMNVGNARLVNAAQRLKLYAILTDCKEETLQLAILKALEQIGDGAAVPYVEKLANPTKEVNVSEKVQEAARECLPFLTARAEQERQSMTLLRAAGTMEAQPGELLRPAATNVESDPRALLRATQQD